MSFALILFCFSSSITPGPNNLMIMMSGLNYGIRRSLGHMSGIVLGFAMMLLLVGLGLNSVFVAFPLLHKIIKVVGSAYILYLAWKTVTATTQLNAGEIKRPISCAKAMIFQLANPKAWVMAIGVYAAFSLPGDGIVQQVLLTSLIFSLILIPCILVWLCGGVLLRNLLQHERHVRIFNWLMGSLLALSIGLMLFI